MGSSGDIQEIFAQELEALSTRKKIVEQRLRQEESIMSEMRFEQEASQQVLKNYSAEQFWSGDSTIINQQLHKLFGKMRLLVRDGEIVNLAKVHHRKLL